MVNDLTEARDWLNRLVEDKPTQPLHAKIRTVLNALEDATDRAASNHTAASELIDAETVIDRIDTALHGDGRSAMLIVVAQEIINEWKERHDRR